MTVKVDFAVKIPVYLPDTQAAPLLCAGAIRYRSVRLSGIADGQNLDLSGFGSRGDKTAIERFLSGTRALGLDSHIFRALAVDLRHRTAPNHFTAQSKGGPLLQKKRQTIGLRGLAKLTEVVDQMEGYGLRNEGMIQTVIPTYLRKAF